MGAWRARIGAVSLHEAGERRGFWHCRLSKTLPA
jgi:hypothetical protein